MNTRSMAIGGALFIALAAGAYALYRAGVSAGRNEGSKITDIAGPSRETTGVVDPETGKRVLYWHDPMVPGQRFDRPGKSPFMDMELVPVYAESGDGGVTIDPRVQQNLGIRVAEVTQGRAGAEISAVGSVAYNERDAAVVQARADGFVERLHVKATLDPVTAGQPLAEVYVPAWVAAQEEYLLVKGLQSVDAKLQLLEGARQRMRLAGMTEDQIALVEASGAVHARLTIKAPLDGVITELSAREGMTIAAGAPLFRINGLSTVWVNAELPESSVTQVHQGQEVKATVAAVPGTVFSGKVSALLPEINLATRTLKARVELANSNNQLTPGMFATLRFAADPGQDVLQVPSEAVIRTGIRTVVMLAADEGRFKAVDVEIGAERGGRTEILSGLMAGQKVVVSGQFLVDSEASLKATETRLSDRGAAP